MEKDFTNVTFRVPSDTYNKYKIVLLKEQKGGRKTPTADLNYYINSVVATDRLKNLTEDTKEK